MSSRVNAAPKLHVLDSGVGGWLLGISPARLARRDPAALTQFGHLLESFAVLYTGEVAYQIADRLYAVPLDALWTGTDADVDLEQPG